MEMFPREQLCLVLMISLEAKDPKAFSILRRPWYTERCALGWQVDILGTGDLEQVSQTHLLYRRGQERTS